MSLTIKVKTVGIKDLKNNLSGWLRELKSCHTVLITDRNQVVAELREPIAGRYPSSVNVLLEQWAQEGIVRRPVQPKKSLPKSGVRLPAGTALRLLDEDRGS